MVRAAATILFNALIRDSTNEVKVAELIEPLQYGFTASAAAEPVGPKFVRITDLQDGKIDWNRVPFCECLEPEKYLLRDNDILFARTGATTGKTHLVRNPQTSVFASYLIRLRPKSNVEAGYLHAFFQSENYWSQIAKEKEGSAQPNVNGDKLTKLRIPFVDRGQQLAIAEFIACVRQRQDGEPIQLPELPRPVSEQRRIVARIEALAAKINEAREVRAEVNEETDALMKANLNRLFGNYYDGIRGDLNLLRWVQLNDVVTDVADGPHITPTYVEEGVPFITVLNITSGRIRFGDNKYVTRDDHAQFQKRARAEVGDVLISKDGTIGIPCLVDTDRPFSFFVSVALVKPQRDVLDGEFLSWVIRAPYLQKRIRERSRGDMIRHLVLREIRDLTIPLPSLPAQRRIVTELNAFQERVDALKKLQLETAVELHALLPSMLDKAFKGKLL
jgi:type I restriction enzyme S subunit